MGGLLAPRSLRPAQATQQDLVAKKKEMLPHVLLEGLKLETKHKNPTIPSTDSDVDTHGNITADENAKCYSHYGEVW